MYGGMMAANRAIVYNNFEEKIKRHYPRG